MEIVIGNNTFSNLSKLSTGTVMVPPIVTQPVHLRLLREYFPWLLLAPALRQVQEVYPKICNSLMGNLFYYLYSVVL